MNGCFDFVKDIISDFVKIKDTYIEYVNLNKLCSEVIDVNILQDYYIKCLQTADEIRYATGGYLVHRGYLSRNIKDPFTVGGCERGKILKKKTSKSKISYEYYFKNRQLVMIKSFFEEDEVQCFQVEFVNLMNKMEIGITYEVETCNDCLEFKNTINNITLCEFDDKTLKRVYSYSRDLNLFTKEILQYKQNRLIEVDFVEFGISYKRKLEVIETDTISFIYNSNDYPNEYFFTSASEYTYPISKANQLFLANDFNK